MGDGDDRALVLVQVALEPRDGLGVQVVGRLVEEQQVRRLEEQAAEGDAAALAAGELRHVGVAWRHAQRVHRGLDDGVEVPGVGGFDLLGKARELVGRLVRVVGGDLVVAVQEVARGADAVLDVPADVLRLVELRLLGEHPDRRRLVELRFAAVLGVLAGHDAKQGGLAGAVRPEDADLGAREEAQGDVRRGPSCPADGSARPCTSSRCIRQP